LFSHSPPREPEVNEQDSSSDTLQRCKVGSTVGTHYFTDTKDTLLFETSTTPSIKSQTEQS